MDYTVPHCIKIFVFSVHRDWMYEAERYHSRKPNEQNCWRSRKSSMEPTIGTESPASARFTK